MIVILRPDVAEGSPEVEAIVQAASGFPGVTARVHAFKGESHSLVEVHLVGETRAIPTDRFSAFPFVTRVVRVSEKYRLVGRHEQDRRRIEAHGFTYRGLRFAQDTFHVFPGLCAVDNRESVDATFRAIAAAGGKTARMGAYKPRTSPYEFQGLGKDCLDYVFGLAAEHGIRVVAMEVLRESHVDEIRAAIDRVGRDDDPSVPGAMLQIGTRNAQNFELLKAVGQRRDFPVLYKRGMGNTLEEALNACEYVASEGNRDVVFCLRGVKTHLSAPHRNLVDFAQVPIVRRLTRLPVCVDPSHSTGRSDAAEAGLTDIHHAAAEGVIAGANMVLVDFHPEPARALCDGPQALHVDKLPAFFDDMAIVREAYEKRLARASC